MVDVPEYYYGGLAHRASTSRLNVLDVDDSPIRYQVIVAVFLSRLFPNLVDELHVLHSSEPLDIEEGRSTRTRAPMLFH